MAEPKERIELPEGDGRYMKINILARRAREINRQRDKDLYDDNAPDPVDVAAQEYDHAMLDFEFRHHLTGSTEDYRSNI